MKQTAREWRLSPEVSADLNSIKNNFNFDYIKKILLKHQLKLDININNIDVLVNYYISKGKPDGKKQTSFSTFFEFTTSKSKKIYWLKRGWSEIESDNKIQEYKNNVSTYINRLIYYGYSNEEALRIYNESLIKGVNTYKNKDNYDEIRKNKFGHKYQKYLTRINPETNKLYTIDEAKYIISEIQKKNSLKSANKRKLFPQKYYSTNNCRIEYYLSKGLTKEEAENALYKRQVKNGLNYYINKYGLTIGTEKYNKRINIFSVKIKEHRKKHPHKWLTWGKRYSDSSKRFFDNLINDIPELKKYKIYYADNEYFIWSNNKIHFYDFYIKELNLIIEYNGIVWHPRERHQKNWLHPYSKETSEKYFDYDQYKIKLLQKNNIDYIILFEDELIQRKKEIINELHKRIIAYNNNK